MAHQAKLASLTEELVTLLVPAISQNDRQQLLGRRDAALRALRHHNYMRTNHFDIFAQLDGLGEKFRVYGEDPLADALHERVHAVATASHKFVPDILHLLLELSDQPVKKTKRRDLEFLLPPPPEEQYNLTWEELAAEDPLLRDESVFATINCGSDSDDFSDDALGTRDDSSEIGGWGVDEHCLRPEDFAIEVDIQKLKMVQESQFWHEPSQSTQKGRLGERLLTGLQAVREILSMLQGLPTSLFKVSQSRTVVIIPLPGFSLKDTSPELFYRVLTEFAKQGSAIAVVRSWTQKKQTVPLLQAFNAELCKRIRAVDREIAHLERKYVAIANDTIVSILDVESQLTQSLRFLLSISDLLLALAADPHVAPFRYLELLHDDIYKSQVAGDEALCQFLGELFLSCFQIYLHPIQRWMEDGQLFAYNKTFFVTEAADRNDLTSLWADAFLLRRTRDGTVYAPAFIQHLVGKIFTTGKSVIVLKRLGQVATDKVWWWSPSETINFEAICSSTSSLTSFSELFRIALEQWILHKHQHTSVALRQCLFVDCGLNESLEALELIYFMRDGAASNAMLDAIFEKIDTANTSWNNQLALTELGQSSVGVLPSVATDRLKVRVSPSKHGVRDFRKSVRPLSAIHFDYLLPWSVQLIVPAATMKSYQAISVLLLQVRRAKGCLHRSHIWGVFDDDSSPSERLSFYGLRARLLWFINLLHHHLTECVIAINTRDMRSKLSTAADLDEMIHIHKTYIQRLECQTLLITRLDPILNSIISILDLCLRLAAVHAAYAQTQQSFRTSLRGVEIPSINSEDRYPRQSGRRERRYSANSDDSGDSDDETESNTGIDALGDGETEMTYAENLRKMRADYEHSCRFITTGLRGVARAGGDLSWDLLAEKIEAGLSDYS